MRFARTVIRTLECVNEQVGRAVAWLALLMVLIQFVVVVMRYVFGISVLAMQESIWYLHAIIFLVAAGYTLLHNAHVRVDILYGRVTTRGRALIDLAGVLCLLFPVCIATVWLSWDYVLNSWKVYEGSAEVSGIQGVYLLKTCIWIFAGTLALQGVALALRSVFVLAGLDDSEENEQPPDGPAQDQEIAL